MHTLERFQWWLSGETARVIEERYDDTADALLFPVLSACFTAAFLYTAGTLLAYSGLVIALVAGVAAVLGAACGVLTIVSTAASVQYAREWTQPEPNPEVLD